MNTLVSSNNIIISGIFFRIIIFIFLVIFPFYHNSFGHINPFSYQEFADLSFYINFGEKDFNIYNFLSNYKNILQFKLENIDNRFPGPLFPIILKITSYEKNFTYALAFVIFFSEITSYLIWSKKKFKNQNTLSLILFSFIPIPLYFGFMHSTDVIFYFLFTLIYFEILNKTRPKNLFILFFLLFMLRPNSLIVFLGSLIYFYLKKPNKGFFFITYFFILISVVYYSPYFFYEIDKLGVFENFYSNNSFKDIIFIIYLFLKKIIFLLGFVPSDSGNIYFYFLRCFCGAIFLVGMINIIYKRENIIDVIFVLCFIILTAVLFFPAYRYILPITPILIFNFFLFFQK